MSNIVCVVVSRHISILGGQCWNKLRNIRANLIVRCERRLRAGRLDMYQVRAGAPHPVTNRKEQKTNGKRVFIRHRLKG